MPAVGRLLAQAGLGNEKGRPAGRPLLPKYRRPIAAARRRLQSGADLHRSGDPGHGSGRPRFMVRHRITSFQLLRQRTRSYGMGARVASNCSRSRGMARRRFRARVRKPLDYQGRSDHAPQRGPDLTTHTGSLPRPPELTRLLIRRARGESIDSAEFDRLGHEALRWVVGKQAESGVDIGNNGEQQREGFFLHIRHRMSGFGGSWQRRTRADALRYPVFRRIMEEQLAARAGGQQHGAAESDRAGALSRPRGDRGRMRGLSRRARRHRRQNSSSRS